MPDIIDKANTQWNTAGTTKRRWIVAAVGYICGLLTGIVFF